MGRNILIAFSVSLVFFITSSLFAVKAQEAQTVQSDSTSQVQSTQLSSPEIPLTPRSKLEIIQYILLPFAIGASIWFILRLEKIEHGEMKENGGE
jgi:hypothetical protein